MSQFNLKSFYKIATWSSVLGVLLFIVDIGFYESEMTHKGFNIFYILVLAIGISATITRYVERRNFRNVRVILFDLAIIFFILFEFYLYIQGAKGDDYFTSILRTYGIKVAVLITFLRELSELQINFKRSVLNPGQLFIASFLFLVFLGSLLLMLPAATQDGISFLDALFTSTSAVCVTGLAVVDTGTYFTLNGHLILLFLIQIGGLGILTFVTYFSYFFKGGTTYENQLTISDILSAQRVGDVFSTLRYVLFITFIIEGASAVLIYVNLDPTLFKSQFDRVFFSIFHAISAFCNAGFSTLPNSMYESSYRYNYSLQFIVILTFMFGALGFPIISNIVSWIKHQFLTLTKSRRTKQQQSLKYKFRPWIVSINSRLTLVTTLSITGIALVLFYVLEFNNTLGEHHGIGKIVTALFGVATPRTAGFNSIDTGAMYTQTTVLIIFLMWIGASPSSTGGGIKTSTVAIAFLNMVSIARGKNRIEVFGREVADISVRRAFAVLTLSLVVIGIGIMLISFVDPEIGFLKITFECFSAYSTVGMSMGITSQLSGFSRFVLIIIMFIGRVSMLSIMIAFFKKARHQNYRFPSEEITIN